MRARFIPAYLLLLFPLFMNCSTSSQNETPNFPFSNSSHYFQTTSSVSVDVFYEPNAQPFVGNTANGRPYWSILFDNLTAIFQYRSVKPNLNVPYTLAQMTALPSQNRTEWTITDILNLHQQYQTMTSTPESARFYIFFVRGHFRDSTGVKTGVIGVHIGDTPVIAIFKEVIQNSVVNPSGLAAKFVEQITLVHEMGHALGFVDLGVAPTSAHADVAHPGHTTNQDCVMYWLNEGASDLQAFVQRYLTSTSVVMWGPEILADARAISR